MGTALQKQTKKQQRYQRELVSRVMLLKHELMVAGLVATAQSMERCTRVIGYEVEALELGTWPRMSCDGKVNAEYEDIISPVKQPERKEPRRRKVAE